MAKKRPPVLLTADPPDFGALRQIPGCPDHFVSSKGEAWSRCWGRWYRLRGSPSKPNGHLKVNVGPTGQKRWAYIHRLVLEAFVGPCPPGMECCHRNGDPQDNRLENLRWDTLRANAADSATHGTKSKGSRHTGAKLLEAEIPIIRSLLAQGALQKDIGARFGVAREVISKIKRGLAWAHVKGDEL